MQDLSLEVICTGAFPKSMKAMLISCSLTLDGEVGHGDPVSKPRYKAVDYGVSGRWRSGKECRGMEHWRGERGSHSLKG